VKKHVSQLKNLKKKKTIGCYDNFFVSDSNEIVPLSCTFNSKLEKFFKTEIFKPLTIFSIGWYLCRIVSLSLPESLLAFTKLSLGLFLSFSSSTVSYI